MHHLADDRQQRHFPHDHLAPWAGEANRELALVIGNNNLAWVIAERPQPVEIVGAEEGQAGEPLVFIILQAQMLHGINLLANGICIDTQQVIAPAAKLSRHVDIMILMKNRLLHMQLIGIGIKQRSQNRVRELCHGAP